MAVILCLTAGAFAAYFIRRAPQTPWGTGADYDAKASSSNLQSLLAKANYFYWLHNLPKAAPLYERANEMATRAGSSRDALYAKVGELRSSDGMSFPQLSSFLETQLQIPLVQNDAELRLWCLGLKGDADDEVNVSTAKQDWEQVLALAAKLGEKQWANRASGELGLAAFLDGDASQASSLIGKAIVTAAAEGDSGTEIRFLEIVGNGFNAVGRTSESMFLLNRAIAIANREPDVGTPFMAYEGKAEALAALGKQDEAQSLMKQTLAEAQSEKMLEHQGQDMLILGEFALQSNRKTEALAYFKEAFQSATRIGLPRVAMESCFEWSQLLEGEGDLTGSEEVLSRGLDISRSTGDTYYLPRALDALAEVKAKSGDIDQAHALYRRAEDTIDGMLVRSPGAYAESSLASAMSATYLDDFKLSASQNDANAAFDAIERVRGRSVLDNMRSKGTNRPHDPSTPQIEDQISKIQSQLLDSDDAENRAKLLDDLSEQEYKLSYTEEALTPAQALVTKRSISLTKAKSDIRPDEAVLEYVLADPVSYCLVLTNKNAVVVPLPASREQIETLTSQYLSSVMEASSGKQEAQRLYGMLIEPIPNSLRMRRLVIVPDGPLYNLSFDALVGPDGKYLLASHVVSYAPSATVLDFIEHRVGHAHGAQMAFLGIGDVPYDMEPRSDERAKASVIRTVSRGIYDISGSHLYPLPETRVELAAISASLKRPKETVLLLGDKATETNLLSEPLADFKVLHFAVHGIVSPNFPERDALVLGRAPDSTDDGLLQVREIAQLKLNADLVALSACNTATGKLEGEDGVVGLTQAFLFAGSRAVASSLWPVDDASTEALMMHFYTHLVEGEDEASALRQAKLDYLNENGEKPPIFWAPFVLVGDASSSISF